MGNPSDSGDSFQELAAEIACSLAEEALATAMNHLPDDMKKDEYQKKLTEFLQGGIHVALSGEDYESYLRHGVYDAAEHMASQFTETALKSIAVSVPDGILKKAVEKDLSSLAKEGISGICNGESFENVQTLLISKASVLAKERATEQAQFMVGKAVESITERCKDKGRGKARTKKNLQIQALSGNLKDSICTNLEQSIEEIWQGRNLDAVCKDMLKRTGKQAIQRFVEENSQKFIQQAGDAIYKQVRLSGKGSRSANRHIRNATDIFLKEGFMHGVNNARAIRNGEKTIGKAAKDAVIGIAKDGSQRFVEEHGTELAVSAINALSVEAEKRIKNEVTRNVVKKGLGKLANKNSVAAMVELAGSVKRLAKGEITKVEFLHEVGEKATANAVSGAFAGAAGFLLPTAAAASVILVAPFVGYYASSILYGSVLKAFEDAEASRKNYELMHEMCEAAIQSMEESRQKFEQRASELLEHRENLFSDCFDRMESAIKGDDFGKFADTLNQITMEFHQELPFHTFEELDAFMSDDNTVLEL